MHLLKLNFIYPTLGLHFTGWKTVSEKTLRNHIDANWNLVKPKIINNK